MGSVELDEWIDDLWSPPSLTDIQAYQDDERIIMNVWLVGWLVD